MRHLNKRATAIFNRIINNHLKDADAVKIDNSSFMALCIDRLCSDVDFSGLKGDIFAFAHYYEQNGDLIPDPDMTFLRLQNGFIFPLTYQDYRSYEEAIYLKDGKWKHSNQLLNDLVSFANKWLNNILYQQKI